MVAMYNRVSWDSLCRLAVRACWWESLEADNTNLREVCTVYHLNIIQVCTSTCYNTCNMYKPTSKSEHVSKTNIKVPFFPSSCSGNRACFQCIPMSHLNL